MGQVVGRSRLGNVVWWVAGLQLLLVFHLAGVARELRSERDRLMTAGADVVSISVMYVRSEFREAVADPAGATGHWVRLRDEVGRLIRMNVLRVGGKGQPHVSLIPNVEAFLTQLGAEANRRADQVLPLGRAAAEQVGDALNVLLRLVHSLYTGRLTAEEAAELGAALGRGSLALNNLSGR